MKTVLDAAQRGHYAVPAFNVCANEHIDCVFAVSRQLQAPVIIAIHPVEIEYFGMRQITDVIKTRAVDHAYPVVMHLDHGDSYERAMDCIVHGFTSVMYDGSVLPFDQNVANTREVVRAAHAVGVSVEGELGLVGGTEGDTYAHTEGLSDDQLTDPAMAVRYVEETGVDSLAVAIGTAHGFYKGEPRIDVDRLAAIRKQVTIPLVLHGGSGTPTPTIKRVIELGICKINISSEFKRAYHEGLAAAMAADPDCWDPLLLFPKGKDRARGLLQEKFELFGSAGKAARTT